MGAKLALMLPLRTMAGQSGHERSGRNDGGYTSRLEMARQRTTVRPGAGRPQQAAEFSSYF
jgi:hypothetical protein